MAGLFNKVPTDLDLNGPILSITTEPTGATGIGTTVGATGGASVAITGVATAIVGSSGTGGSGYLSYQWYEEGVGALSNGTYITGTASTGAVGSTATLTLSNLVTPTDNDRKFYLEVDYVPSYTVGVQSVTEAGYTTGNAWNEPITSGVATVTVTPLIDIVAQPSNRQVLLNTNTIVSVNADLTDSSFADDLTFQWYVDGEEVTDGVKTYTTTTGSVTSGTVENYYATNATHTFPSISIADVEITVAAARGGEGGDDSAGPGGHSGHGSAGKFYFKNNPDWLGKTVEIYTGQVGNDGTSGNDNSFGAGGSVPGESPKGAGGRGGAAGETGWSGGGGGGGGSSYIEDADNNVFIAAGAGSGGGGGSNHVGGQGGASATSWTGRTGPLTVKHGRNGQDKGSGDGGGGGGGGGGFVIPGDLGAAGGEAGTDNSHGGRRGDAGKSAYDQSRIMHIYNSGSEINFPSNSNGYVNLKYTGFTDTTVTTVRNTTISGSTSANLTLASDLVGVQTCMCKITSATASNSPIYTDTVNVVFNSTVTDNLIKVEGIGIGITASLASLNLNNGDFTLQTQGGDVSTGQINNEWVLYSPDKDLDVEMDLYGGKGEDWASLPTDINQYASGSGGEGGYSRIRFTMKQNEEYVITGLTTSINTPFLYRKGTLIACVGEGGDAGPASNGGAGGGVSISGNTSNGQHGNGGKGGDALLAGSLTLNGIFGTAAGNPPLLYPGDEWAGDNAAGAQSGVPGRTISCTKGVYWAQQGIAACNDVGTGKFRLSGGEEVTNTTTAITRGYKSGYNIIQTAGLKRVSGQGGNGGNGCTGGQGGFSAGGGGGSGYTDGSVTVVSATLGGSTGDGKVVLRLQS